MSIIRSLALEKENIQDPVNVSDGDDVDRKLILVAVALPAIAINAGPTIVLTWKRGGRISAIQSYHLSSPTQGNHTNRITGLQVSANNKEITMATGNNAITLNSMLFMTLVIKP